MKQGRATQESGQREKNTMSSFIGILGHSIYTNYLKYTATCSKEMWLSALSNEGDIEKSSLLSY
jgi:hypothetical protein